MSTRLPAGHRISRYWIAAVLVWVGVVPATGAAAQTVDSFDPGADDYVLAIAVQPDDKVLVGGFFSALGGGGAGETTRHKIGRLNRDGSLDTSFDPGLNVGLDAHVEAIAVQPDGRILVAGYGVAGGRNIVRLNADGSLDASFTGAADDSVLAVALQPDGKILVGGFFSTLSGTGTGALTRFGLGRFNANGSVDTTFDAPVDGWVEALLVQADGRILVGGSFSMLAAAARQNIGRLEASGAVDSGFDPGTDPGFRTRVAAFAVQPDGRILVGGHFATLGGAARHHIGRLLPSAAIDPGFVPPPEYQFDSDLSPFVESIVVLPNRKILIGGYSVAMREEDAPGRHLALLNADGTLDVTYDVVTDREVLALAPQSDGRIVVGGAFDSFAGRERSYLARFDPSTYASSGKLMALDGVFANQGRAVALSADGHTALVGGASDDDGMGAAWLWTRTVRVIGTPGLPRVVWLPAGKLTASNPLGSFVSQGASVALSADGSTAIVGAPGDNNYKGAAWVFVRTGDAWTQQAKLVGSGATGAFPSQGGAVALSADGNTAIVGAAGEGAAGAAWVFTRSGGAWAQQGSKLEGVGAIGSAAQGTSVALSADGNTAIVGGNWDDSQRGAAWIWTRSGGVWTQQGPKLVGSSSWPTGNQGIAVSLSADGNTALVGGNRDGNWLGAAWVWTRNAGVWAQQGPKLVADDAIGQFIHQGWSVALSGDGNVAVVGGFGDNNFTGAAWVWTRRGNVWTQRAGKLVGSNASGAAQQGEAVAISADGSTILSGGGVDAEVGGAAWVFSAPAVLAPTATNLTGTTAVLGANISANGNAPSGAFDYGLSSSYGRTVWGAPAVPLGVAAVRVSAAIDGLACATSYHYRAVGANEVATYGHDVVFTTAPCAPAITTITPGNRQLNVAFTPAAAGAAVLTNYQYSLDGGTTWIARTPVATSSPLVISNLSNGVTYQVRLRGVSASGEGLPSLSASATPSSVPGAPTITGIVPASNQLTVAFTAGGDGGFPISNYRYSTDGGASWTTRSPAATTSPLVISGLINGTPYQVQLRAVNAIGEGVASATVAGTPATTPEAPSITSINPANGQLIVAFTAGATGGATITNIEYSTNNGSTWVARTPSSVTTPLFVGNLANGTTYQVRLRAVNALGAGAVSGAMAGTPSTTPAAPSVTGILPGNGQLTVFFTAGGDGGRPITTYEYSTSSGGAWQLRVPAGTASPLVIAGLSNGVPYGVQIRAVNDNGPGTATPVVSVTPQMSVDETADDFNPGADGEVRALSVQTDGRILVGGRFTHLGGNATLPRHNLGRLQADGAADATFNPANIGADSHVTAVVVQSDGRMLVAGDGPDPGGDRTYITRLHPDGSVDTGFRGAANGAIYALAVQPDGKILIGGAFTALGLNSEAARLRVGRLNADGTVDPTFNPGVNGEVRTLAVQSDGKVLIGGAFTAVGGGLGTVPRSNLARLHADGSVDSGFDAGAGAPPTAWVAALWIQSDGRILVGGRFATLGGGGAGTGVRHNVGRLLASGALDTTFDAGPGAGPSGSVSPTVAAVVMLPTGRILVGGEAVAAPYSDQQPRHLARLTRNGTLDAGFEPRPNGIVRTILPYTGGRVLVGGDFTAIGGRARQRVARLQALGPADPDTPLVPVPFTDDPIVAGVTVLRAVHLVELRARTNALRQRFQVPAAVWTNADLAGTPVRAVHIQELRDALLGAYDAALFQGVTVARPLFVDGVLIPGSSPVRAVHIEQLRAAVRALEVS